MLTAVKPTPILVLCSTLALSSLLHAQIAVVKRSSNLRPTSSTAHAPLRELLANDTVDVLSLRRRNGYIHVRTRDDSTAGWLYSANIRIDTTVVAVVVPIKPASPAKAPLEVVGSSSFIGCGDHLWTHVYNPQRLLIHQPCVTVSGVIVDATAGLSHRQPDGVRHEGDGDTHGWLKLDPQFASLLAPGNNSDEGGNLVFEIVCHFRVTQADAKPACAGLTDSTQIPPVGSHVEITGAFVQDENHAHWNEIHPVSRIVVVPSP